MGRITANRFILGMILCLGAGIGLIYLPEPFIRVALGLFVGDKIYDSLTSINEEENK